MGVLRDGIATAVERWIRSRNPPCREVTLGQKQIFIMPNRFGLGLLCLVLTLFLMGTNYQNNLVLALAFWLLAVFVLSILLTYYNLAGLTLKAGHGDPGHVNATVTHVMSLHSRRERYGVLVTGLPVPGDRVLSAVQDDGRWLEALSEEATESLTLQCTYARRGEHRAPRVRLDTRFPFGWITAWVFWNPLQSVLVWPAVVDHGVDRHSAGGLRGNRSTAQPGHAQLDDLRAYEPGDSLRRVLWRQYARRGELHVKTPPPAVRSDTEQLDLSQVASLPLEHGLEQIAFWVVDCATRGVPWSLQLGAFKLPAGQGARHQRACLDALATCERASVPVARETPI